MSKATSVKINVRRDAKSAQLAAKYTRALNAHAYAIAYCEANGVKGAEKTGYVAFASTAMQADSVRGAIARAALHSGRSATFSYKELAKAAKVSIADMSRANLAYIRHNIEYRVDLVGFTFDYNVETETVTVRPVRAAPVTVKPKKAKPSTEEKAGETVSE
jgi:hypothetical protein